MSNFYGQKLPIKFEQFNTSHKLKYLEEITTLYNRYIENLEDDFSPLRLNPQKILDYIEKITPYFYIVLFNDKFCGFITLENIVGNEIMIYSAEVSICLKRKYWGKSATKIAQIFKNYVFFALKIVKLKALIYPQNSLIKRLLKNCGFKKEALLKAETIKNNKPQDIEIYTLFNTRKGGFNAL